MEKKILLKTKVASPRFMFLGNRGLEKETKWNLTDVSFLFHIFLSSPPQ